MRISPINFLKNNIQTKQAPVNFGRITNPKTPYSDVFQFSNEKVRSAQIKDQFGNIEDVQIKEIKLSQEEIDFYGKGAKKLYLTEGQKIIGHMVLSESTKGDSIYINELFCKKYVKNYKGRGTLLLKEAVKESIKRGHSGRVTTFASYEPPPFVFYYKNNFLPEDKKYLDYIDFAAKYNIPIENVLEGITGLKMTLDERGAKALLEGKRLYY